MRKKENIIITIVLLGLMSNANSQSPCFPPPDAKARDWLTHITPSGRYYFPANYCVVSGLPDLQPTPYWRICQGCNDPDAGYMMALYTDNNPQGSPSVNKPLVIVPGFDFSRGGPNQMTLASLENSLRNSGFLGQLTSAGFDVFIVMFKNPHIWTQNNVQTLMQALNEVQATSGHMSYGNEIIVLGISSGGVIARYALQELGVRVENGGSFYPKLLVTLDSPHRGADIPISVQNLLRYSNSKSAEAGRITNIILSSAAGQLLIKQHKGGRSGTVNHDITNYETLINIDGTLNEHGRFMAEINAPSYIGKLQVFRPYAGFTTNPACQMDQALCSVLQDPSNPNCDVDPIKCSVNSNYLNTAAITNGQSDGLGYGYAPGQEYLGMYHPLSTRICVGVCPFCICRTVSVSLARLHLHTSTPSLSARSRVFIGKYLDQDEYTYNLREPVLTENAPGSSLNYNNAGIYTLIRTLTEGITVFGTRLTWNSANLLNYQTSSFIPTISAAGVVSSTVNINNVAAWFISPSFITSNSLFKQIYLAPTNQSHVNINPGNVAFLLSLL